MSASIVRTYRLPFGFSARFSWQNAHLEVEWSPQFPRIKKQRAWRKLFTAYQAARRDFHKDIAAMVGGNILIVDTDLKTIDGIEVVAAPTKH